MASLATRMNSRRSRKRASAEEPHLAKVDYAHTLCLFLGWRTSYESLQETKDLSSSLNNHLYRQKLIGNTPARAFSLSPELSQSDFEADLLGWIDPLFKEPRPVLLVLYCDSITGEGLWLRPPSRYTGENPR